MKPRLLTAALEEPKGFCPEVKRSSLSLARMRDTERTVNVTLVEEENVADDDNEDLPSS